MSRSIVALVVVVCSTPIPAAASWRDPSSFSIGVRGGLIPPVLGALELLFRPAERLAVSLFGIHVPDSDGDDGSKTTIGAALTRELAKGRSHGAYASLSTYYYWDAPDAGGRGMKTATAALTAGYLWKFGWLDVQLGAGLQFLLFEDKPPCEWFCGMEAPPVLPAIDLAIRYSF